MDVTGSTSRIVGLGLPLGTGVHVYSLKGTATLFPSHRPYVCICKVVAILQVHTLHSHNCKQPHLNARLPCKTPCRSGVPIPKVKTATDVRSGPRVHCTGTHRIEVQPGAFPEMSLTGDRVQVVRAEIHRAVPSDAEDPFLPRHRHTAPLHFKLVRFQTA